MKKFMLLLLFLFAGCATAPPAPQPVISRIPFPTAEYERLKVDGTATVKGGAFLKTVGGEVKTAAGEEVLLIPKTSYTAEWYDYYLNGVTLRNDPLMDKCVKIRVADSAGNFEFTGVGAGDYYLITTVQWQVYVQNGRYPYWSRQGGVIAQPVQVAEGQTVNVVLTR